MADNDLDVSDSETSDRGPLAGRKPKRRRLHGACDTCRRKKVKCDSAIMPDNVCTNCSNSKVPCTHNIPRQKKKDTQQEYIRTLEDRLRKMENVLRMSPSSRSSKDPSTSSEKAGSPHANTFPDLPLPVPRSVSDIAVGSPSSLLDDANGGTDDDLAHVALAEKIKALSLQSVDGRFFGQSSMFAFTQQAVIARRDFGGITPNHSNRLRRPYFWALRDWEREYVYESPHPTYVFPEPDLLADLTAVFFERIHIIYPAVHRQTYERDLANQRHLTDPKFGMVVLAVCALASRHSDDPRVFQKREDADGVEGSSAGWKYISQVPIWRKSLCDRNNTYDMQYYALASFYFVGTSMPQISWNVTGIGLRLAQERGLHRRRGVGIKPNVVDEAESRAFWCLVASDRIQSSFLGRPSALQDEDIDCDYPIECDDEYWETEDPMDAFQQPPGKPSYASSFTYNLKLCEIMGFMMRTLYSTKKSKILSGLIGEEWETRVVTELDSSLNKWKDSLPLHLVWDPSNPNNRFYNQSLHLHCTFYYLQIQVHRPFLKGNSPLALSSLAICTNAARACSHAVEGSTKRQAYSYPNVIMAAFVSAMVLTVNFWSSTQSRLTYDPMKEMADIERCRVFMSQAETRWFVAGRFLDMMTEFSVARDHTPPEKADAKSNKRSRQVDLPPQQPPLPDQPQPQYFTQWLPKAPTPIAPLPRKMQSSSNHGHPRPTYVNNDWDLSSLLLAQMGYDQPLGNNFPVHVPNNNMEQLLHGASLNAPYNAFDSFSGHPHATAFSSGGSATTMGNQGGSQYVEPMYDMSMWMSAPKSFSSYDDWDAIIATVGPQETGPC